MPFSIISSLNTHFFVKNIVIPSGNANNIYTISNPIYFTNINCFPYALTATANTNTNILSFSGNPPCNKYITNLNINPRDIFVRLVDNNGYYYNISSVTTNTITLKQSLLSPLNLGQIVLVQNINLVETDNSKYTTGYTQHGICSYPYPYYTNTQVIACSKSGQYITIVSVNKIFISSNYGSTFTIIDTSNNMVAVAMSSSGQYQIAVSDNMPSTRTYTSTDYGSSWTSFQNNSNNPGNMGRYINSCVVSSNGQYLAAISGGAYGQNTTHYSSNYGTSYKYFTYNPVSNFGRCSVLMNDVSLTTFTVGDCLDLFNYIITYTMSNGLASSITLPFKPQTICSNGTSIFCTDISNGYYSPNYTTSFTTKAAIPENPTIFTSYINNNLYACSFTTLYKSTNNGDSWTVFSRITTSSDPIYAMTTSPTNDHSYIYFVTNGGKVYSVVPS